MFNFEYDIDIRLNPAAYDIQIEKSDYFAVCLSEPFLKFLKKQFAIYSYDKYFLSSADLNKIFETVHSNLMSGRLRRV